MDSVDLRHLKLAGTLYGPLCLIGGWAARTTAVDAALIYAPLSGTLWITLESGQPALSLRAGALALLPTGVAHRVASDAAINEDIAIDDLLRRRRDRQNAVLVHRGTGEVPVIDMWSIQSFWAGGACDYLRVMAPPIILVEPATMTPSIRLLASAIDTVGRDPGPAVPMMVNHLANALILAILAEVLQKPMPADTLRLPMPNNAALRDREVVRKAAQRAEISQQTFARRFAAMAGESPNRFLREQRLARAKAMIEEGGHGIADIARACGYQSATSFTKAFGKRYGCAPSRWHRATGER